MPPKRPCKQYLYKGADFKIPRTTRYNRRKRIGEGGDFEVGSQPTQSLVPANEEECGSACGAARAINEHSVDERGYDRSTPATDDSPYLGDVGRPAQRIAHACENSEVVTGGTWDHHLAYLSAERDTEPSGHENGSSSISSSELEQSDDDDDDACGAEADTISPTSSEADDSEGEGRSGDAHSGLPTASHETLTLNSLVLHYQAHKLQLLPPS